MRFHLTFSQKLLLGFGGLAAFLFITAPSASAATAAPAAGGGGGGGGGGGMPATPLPAGGNVTTPNAGDRLLVATQQTGAAGQLNIRKGPGIQNAIIGAAPHGSTLSATGQVQTATDGTAWWQVSNGSLTGWSEALFLHDMGP